MARPKDNSKFINSVNTIDYTKFTKEELEQYQTILKAQVKAVATALKDYDYNKELAELNKKYGKK